MRSLHNVRQLDIGDRSHSIVFKDTIEEDINQDPYSKFGLIIETTAEVYVPLRMALI